MKNATLRRARPLLGTLVEITASGDSAVLCRDVGRAFAAIERLQARLSFHDPASEVSRLNREAAARAIRVSIDTWRVLRPALALSLESGGAFDVTVGGEGSFLDIELLPGRRVRFRRALHIDLGGIAKGYCVDRAVAVLERAGVRSALVNAGGDLRAFGPRAFPVCLRHPQDPSRLLPWRALRDAALATSANYAATRGRWAGELRDGRGGAPIGRGASVTVRASRAMLADALTKVVAACGERAAAMLARHGARAWILHAGRAACATAA